MNILVVDDDSYNRSLIKAYLNKGHNLGTLELTFLNDGTEAVEIYKNRRFDIVFMDVKMAIMDGVVATRLIKEIDKDVFVIGMTSFPSLEEIEKYANEKPKFDCHLKKPFNQPTLLDLMRSIIEKLELKITS